MQPAGSSFGVHVAAQLMPTAAAGASPGSPEPEPRPEPRPEPPQSQLQTSPPTLLTLEPDVQLHLLFHFCDTGTLLAAASACRALRELVRSAGAGTHWQERCIVDLRMPPGAGSRDAYLANRTRWCPRCANQFRAWPRGRHRSPAASSERVDVGTHCACVCARIKLDLTVGCWDEARASLGPAKNGGRI